MLKKNFSQYSLLLFALVLIFIFAGCEVLDKANSKNPNANSEKENHSDEDDTEVVNTYTNINALEFDQMLKSKDFLLVDVHIPEQEHIESTDTVVAYNEIEDNLNLFPEDKNSKIVVYCRSGSMSVEASNKLVQHGYKNVFNLQGGKDAYVQYVEQK